MVSVRCCLKCIFSSVGPQLSGNPTDKEKVDFSGHDRVSGRFYLKTQQQSMGKTRVHSWRGEPGRGLCKIQKDRKKESKKKFEEKENKGF